MVQFLSEHLNEPIERILYKAGINEEDFKDKEAFDLLGIILAEPKKD